MSCEELTSVMLRRFEVTGLRGGCEVGGSGGIGGASGSASFSPLRSASRGKLNPLRWSDLSCSSVG